MAYTQPSTFAPSVEKKGTLQGIPLGLHKEDALGLIALHIVIEYNQQWMMSYFIHRADCIIHDLDVRRTPLRCGTG